MTDHPHPTPTAASPSRDGAARRLTPGVGGGSPFDEDDLHGTGDPFEDDDADDDLDDDLPGSDVPGDDESLDDEEDTLGGDPFEDEDGGDDGDPFEDDRYADDEAYDDTDAGEEEDGNGGEDRTERRRLHDTAAVRERVILMGVTRPPSQLRHDTDEHLDELELLAETAGAEVVEKMYQNRSSISPSTFIGSGKMEALKERCEEVNVQTVIFDDDLTPVQQRNLERGIGRKVVDRTTLILDIFARHARTATARTQVELAQLEYLLPRLSGMWTHLSKQYGGIRTKGPGETQIETDRRIVRDRITHLRHKLARIDRQRATQRKSRRDVTRVALVGYTNVGKSTLLNILTGAEVLAENKLFATLDSTVRAMQLGRNTVLLTDTVGFIRKLPTKLVASFKSTLDEVVEADIILHVVDIAHPAWKEQIDVVLQTLKDIGADGKPMITVFNKIDMIDEGPGLAGPREAYQYPVFISAARGLNLPELLSVLERLVERRSRERIFEIRPPDYRIAAAFHQHATVRSERYEDDAITLRCQISPELAERLLKQYAAVLRELEEMEEG